MEQWIRNWWTILIQISCVVLHQNWWSNHMPYDHLRSRQQQTFVFNFHKLNLHFLSHHSSFSNNSSQSVLIFYNKTKLFICLMNFIKQCGIFRSFILFFLEASWSNWTTMNWRSTSLLDMDSKLVTKLSKDEGRFTKNTMYMCLHLQFSPQWDVIYPRVPSPCWCAQASLPLLAFWWWRTSFE